MEPKDRLKLARRNAGFERPTDAARAHKEINQNTLISHENGNRPVSKNAAQKYAQLFGVDAGWILYGEGNGPSSATDPKWAEFTELFSQVGEKEQNTVLELMRSLAAAKKE
ncbi:helix-turn-helix domain-containing protein [Falsochrobactrum ovis]|uniref:HTH cro/C1-type domain-containing protein n=1 Tax=Falsochrobactrum ovis TaxID=1293442 RepID=A0A364JVI1_9HYPH|nr:helix-turn-helix transcriptional regulator [Falsochrobactrum ovis]RAK29123.1 hypothetical protein C7374_105174 [Falsochrobactrum ovis]